MKVIHVVESLAIGGLEKVVLSLVSWQLQQGHSSRVICLFEEGAMAEQARAHGIKVDSVGKRHGLDLAALGSLRHALRQAASGDKIDVLHTHNPVCHYYSAAAALGLGISRLVSTRHGMGPASESGRLDLLYRIALLGTDAAVAVCHAGQRRFVQAGVIPARIAGVVPNGVAVTGIEPRHDAAKARLLSQLNRPAESILLGTVGRLSPVKDIETMLRALQRLRQAGWHAELAVAGDGETRPALEALAKTLQIEKSVHFLGMRSDVAQLLSAFDVFVQSSLSEGYSLALVEAAAAQLPIVATRVGGNADIVMEGVNGLLVEPRDTSAMANALTLLLDSADLRDRMGLAGRSWAMKSGTIEAMGLAYDALYREGPFAGFAPAPAVERVAGGADK